MPPTIIAKITIVTICATKMMGMRRMFSRYRSHRMANCCTLDTPYDEAQNDALDAYLGRQKWKFPKGIHGSVGALSLDALVAKPKQLVTVGMTAIWFVAIVVGFASGTANAQQYSYLSGYPYRLASDFSCLLCVFASCGFVVEACANVATLNGVVVRGTETQTRFGKQRTALVYFAMSPHFVAAIDVLTVTTALTTLYWADALLYLTATVAGTHAACFALTPKSESDDFVLVHRFFVHVRAHLETAWWLFWFVCAAWWQSIPFVAATSPPTQAVGIVVFVCVASSVSCLYVGAIAVWKTDEQFQRLMIA